MEYEERICRVQGNYIVASGKDFEDILIKEPMRIITGVINPDDYTTLNGWFTKPVKYCGMLADPGSVSIKKAIFYLGEGFGDLFFFNTGYYYDLTYILGPNHIGKCYARGTFRDFYLRENKNKYNWK